VFTVWSAWTVMSPNKRTVGSSVFCVVCAEAIQWGSACQSWYSSQYVRWLPACKDVSLRAKDVHCWKMLPSSTVEIMTETTSHELYECPINPITNPNLSIVTPSHDIWFQKWDNWIRKDQIEWIIGLMTLDHWITTLWRWNKWWNAYWLK
jgi:hypothetical protein